MNAWIFSSLNGGAVVNGAAIVSGWLSTLSALISTGLHTWTPLERALGVLAAGFVAAAVLGRPLALLLRVALIVAGVLVAARLAGVGI